MYREPDWEALNDLNFLLHNRLVTPLGGALSALEKTATPPNADWWHDRATSQIAAAINLVNAWSWLIQFKAHGQIPERSIQPFPIQSLADWLTIQLQLVPPLIIAKNFLIRANQAALQESILLLYDVASSQGTSTKLIVDTGANGVLFRIRFSRLREVVKPFDSIEEMIASLGENWRGRIIALELNMARELLRMNSSDLQFRDSGPKVEFVFVIRRKSKADTEDVESSLLIPSHDSQAVINIAEATLPVPQPAEHEPIVAESPTLHLIGNSLIEETWVLKPMTIKASGEIPTAASSVRAMVPDTPFRPGGWYRPKRASTPPSSVAPQMTPVIVKVELPPPTEPGDFKVKSRRLATKTSSQPMPQLQMEEKSSSGAETGPQQLLQEGPSEVPQDSTAPAIPSSATPPTETATDTLRLFQTDSPDISGRESIERK